MRLTIQGLAALRFRLERHPGEIAATALGEQAERLAQSVRDGLAEPPGGGDHGKPRLRTGRLRESIGAAASGLEAAVGSNDPAAAPNEMGTSRIPPRPFLAPAAAAAAPDIARSIGQAVAETLADTSSKL